MMACDWVDAISFSKHMKVSGWFIVATVFAHLGSFGSGLARDAGEEVAGDPDLGSAGACERVPGSASQHEVPAYLAAPFDYSEEELSNHYEQAVAGGQMIPDEEMDEGVDSDGGQRWWLAGELVYLAPIPDLVWEMRAESELVLADGGADPVEAADAGERIRRLEEENALLKERLERLEDSMRPKERPRPASTVQRPGEGGPRLLRRGFVPRKPFPGASSIAASPRFRAFTREGMSLRRSGIPGRDEGRSLLEQLRFTRNANKALGNEVESRHYQDVRLEVIKAMLDGEINARFAVQYLADLVDVFRTYERLAEFGLADGVRPPLSLEEVRRDPDGLFVWVSEVNEQNRKLVREELLSREQ